MSYLTRELKPYIEKGLGPLVETLHRLGVTPNSITLTGFLLVCAGSYILYAGQKLPAVLLLTLGATMDMLDGVLARRSGRRDPFGAFLDSFLDRLSDAAPMVAIAMSSESKLLLLLSFTTMITSFGVSYARARAEGLGFNINVGLFERPERWILFLTGLVLDMLTLTLIILSVGSTVTILQRVYTLRKLTERR